jgi:N6-adenosine-specific RNA methylase IME4
MPTPPPGDRPASVIRAPRGEHSAKPAIVHKMIERMYPTLPRIELFCRTPREGWKAWGNQA